MQYIIALVIFIGAFVIVNWLMELSPKLAPIATPVAAVAAIIAALIYAGAIGGLVLK